MPTPHNSAELHQIAPNVLMPGDPLRAKFIAETFFESPQQVNGIRGMLAYTGTYKGKPVTAMGSGMGMPSIGIYSYELYKFYGVEKIIRVGSAISYVRDIGLMEVILGTASASQSSFARCQSGCTDEILYPDPDMVRALEESAARLGVAVHKGVISSSDIFYHEEAVQASAAAFREKHGCICGEMESFALFNNARVTGGKAAALITISDSAFFQEESTPEERQTGFRQMIQIALESL